MQLLQPEFFGPYLGSNIISAALIVSAIKWPRLTRALFVAVFLAAGIFNAYTALTEPDAYLIYADTAALELYRNFINGFFSEHSRTLVLAIALGQMIIAALLCGNHRCLDIGVAGGVIFFVAIMPLGVGSAFPAPLLLAIAIILMWRCLVRDQPGGSDVTD